MKKSNIMVNLPGTKYWLKVFCARKSSFKKLGKYLEENFNTYEKALELVLMGDISNPGFVIEPTYSDFDFETSFYMRDFGITAPCRIESNSEGLDMDETYIYRFKDNQWLSEKIPSSKKLKKSFDNFLKGKGYDLPTEEIESIFNLYETEFRNCEYSFIEWLDDTLETSDYLDSFLLVDTEDDLSIMEQCRMDGKNF